MSDALAIAATTLEYLARHPEENERLMPFLQFLEGTAPGLYADRHHPVGHVTTSGFLVSEKGDTLLLIYHLKLGRFLQPGGHVEQDASLLASALREIHEEVGLSPERLILCQPDHTPIDIDPHRIPERKGQPGHWHFDFRYLFRVDSHEMGKIQHQADEVARPAWFAWDAPEVIALLPTPLAGRLRSAFDAHR